MSHEPLDTTGSDPEESQTSPEDGGASDDTVADPEALAAERDALREQLQHVSADYQNYVKRNDAQLNETLDLARGDLLKTLLPVLDHMDHALAVKPEGAEAEGFHQGMRIARDEMTKVFQQAGLERIEPAVGQPFDPRLHQAMFQQPCEGVEPHHIAALLRVGYLLRNRVLRPAEVAVVPESVVETEQEEC